MSIARYARKERLHHGDQKKLAAQLGISEPVISLVMNDKIDNLSARTVLRVRKAIARKLKLTVDEAFPLEGVQKAS